MEMKKIAVIKNDFATKFGIPRQPGLAPDVISEIVFEKEYANPDAIRGLEGFSHLWLIWEFSENKRDGFSPTVRPPRLGGETRLGVFATRSPFRPNPVGLSCVKICDIKNDPAHGPIILVSGADLMDGTPIYDIKPYVAYTDSHPDARGGFTDEKDFRTLSVNIPPELLETFPADKINGLYQVLSQDMRPAYHKDSDRVYGLSYGGYDVRFKVRGAELTVCRIVKE